MVISSEQNVHAKRSVTSITGEDMDKLSHRLGKNFRRHLFAEVVLKLCTVLSCTVYGIATIRNISSCNLAYQSGKE